MRKRRSFGSTMFLKSVNVKSFALCAVGFAVGFFIHFLFCKQLVLQLQTSCFKIAVDDKKPLAETKAVRQSGIVFVGVMTAEKFLNTRAKAVYETWGKTIPGKLEFFSSSSSARSDLPLVSLPGVDDTYPPQRKSMMMLKYMHDNYIDDFEWFIRADDDVYIRTDKLTQFLQTLDSSKDLYIGQAGTGKLEEKATMGLGWEDNYCMGGPGVVLSKSTLRKLVLNVNNCLQVMHTTHEDVEIGRCVKLFVGVSCTWALEMQSLFYHNKSKSLAFTQNLDAKEVRNAITLHPIKRPSYMYRLHVYFLKQKIKDALYQTVLLNRQLRFTKWLMENDIANVTSDELFQLNDIRDFHHRMSKEDNLDWEMMTPRKIYSHTENAPAIDLLNPTKDAISKVIKETRTIVNKEARSVMNLTLAFERFNHGHRRYHPTYGAQFMLDLFLQYSQDSGYNGSNITDHVCHNAYLQQPVGNLVYRTEKYQSADRPIHILLPLSGRLFQFKRFMIMFEELCLKVASEHVLMIIYFVDTSPCHEHKAILDRLKTSYNTNRLRWVEVHGPFSRGLALSIGARHFSRASDLLFFCDVDIDLREDFFHRCQSHSILGKQVYYPIVFSQFNPDVAYFNDTVRHDKFSYANNAGFWRGYAFGMACMHCADLDHIGGFNTSIKGWGMEDVELYERFVASDTYDVFRAVDPAIAHVYHDVSCNLTLAPIRYKMCLGSKSQVYGSEGKILEILINTGYH